MWVHTMLGPVPTFGAAPLQLPLGAFVYWLSCAPVPADAMARPEPLEVAEVPEGRPHDVPASLLTTFMLWLPQQLPNSQGDCLS